MTRRVVFTIAVAAALFVSATQPALALDEVPSEATLSLSGDLVLLSDEGYDLVREAGEVPSFVEPEPTMFSVVTDDGAIVTVTGDIPDGAETGDSFVGEVAIPEDVATELDVADGAVVDADSALGTEVVELATNAESPLVVESSEISSLPVSGVLTASAHTFDVAVVRPANFAGVSATFVSDSAVANMVSAVGQYWVTQTNGQISSVTQPATTQRYVSTGNCATQSLSFIANGFWQEAAAKFGHSEEYYYTGGGHHLIVILPESCKNSGTGLGTIGSGLHTGGFQLATVVGDTLLPVVTHEIGHNVGLGHSNLSYCGTPVYDEGSGCSVYQYEDIYSVMGYAIVNYPVLTALPAPMKAALQAYPGGDLLSLSGLGTTTHTLLPASNGSGLRGIKAIDPITGEAYYIELRSGSGGDSNAFYMQGGSTLPACDCWGSGPGVRILKLVSGSSGKASVVHAVVTDPTDPRFAYPALYPGEEFTARSGAFKVTVNTLTPTPYNGTSYQPTSASVTISMGAWTGVNPAPAVARISGPDRYSTSAAVAQKFASATTVYVASGRNYPDALSAAPAAAFVDAPLLLSEPTSLPAVIAAEIVRLHPARIVVVGGTGVLSPAVFNALDALWPDDEVVRIAGANRYETSRLITRDAFIDDETDLPLGGTTAFIATGTNFPDSLSASAAAGKFQAPVILVYGPGSTVDTPTRELLADLQTTDIYVAGGSGVVSTSIFNTLTGLPGITSIARWAGTDRYKTSQVINENAFDVASTAYFVVGTGYADALSGAALAGGTDSPLFVVPGNCVPPAVLDAIDDFGVTKVRLLGGTGVLSARVAALLPC